jgi:hypothetical protein
LNEGVDSRRKEKSIRNFLLIKILAELSELREEK